VISFDLKCSHHHVFEAWFRSSADFELQQAEGLLLCPTCGDQKIAKSVMAPAVATKGNRKTAARQGAAGSSEEAVPVAAMSGDDAERINALMTALAEAQAKMIGDSEWVGDRFADKARAIYYGEAEPRIIHGTANPEQTREMLDEGLPVAPLLIPIAPPDKTH